MSTKVVVTSKRFDNTKHQTKEKIDNEAYKKFIWEEPREKVTHKSGLAFFVNNELKNSFPLVRYEPNKKNEGPSSCSYFSEDRKFSYKEKNHGRGNT